MIIRGFAPPLVFAMALWTAPATWQSPACPSTVEVDMSTWTTHDEGDFVVRLPPEYTRREGRSIDSKGAVWRAPGRILTYDYGHYSNPLTSEHSRSFPEMVVCRDSERPTDPRVIAFRAGEGSYLQGTPEGHGVAGHWPRLRETVIGTVSLTVIGRTEDPRFRGELLAILQTVVFKEDASGARGAALEHGERREDDTLAAHRFRVRGGSGVPRAAALR
jgi:hypothetical protein